MRFSEIPGREDIKARLVELVDSGRLPHALLLSGPEGGGKLSLARALAQYLQCTSPRQGDSCGECPSCRQHRSMGHADMHYVYPVVKRKSEGKIVSADYSKEWVEFLQTGLFASWAKWLDVQDAGNSRPQIAVEEAGEILRVANMTTYSSKVKIVLIWCPEKMGTEAANKLLKIIEEPWADTKYILVSNEPGAILPTIFSRTQNVSVPRMRDEDIATLLHRDYHVEEVQAMTLARLAQGNACRALESVGVRGELDEFAAWFREIMRKAYSVDLVGLRDLADKAAAMGREKNCRLMEYCTRQVRENFIYNLNLPSLNVLTEGEEQFSRAFSPFVHAGNAEEMTALFDRACSDIGRNASAKIVMFDTLLHLIVLIKRKLS